MIWLWRKMAGSSSSSRFSSSSAMSLSFPSTSESSSSHDVENIDSSQQTTPTFVSRGRSTSLFEWKQAPSVKSTQISFNDPDDVHAEILNSVFTLNHAATTYLDNYKSYIQESKDLRLNTSASAAQLASNNSTPEFPRSTTISRANSIKTNCSCYSCSIQGR